MQKIRINDLARELEVKSKAILDVLVKVGVTEKKTHSSSIEVDEAERVKKYFAEHAEPGSGRSFRPPAQAEEFKPKIDLSHISKPGDVRKLVEQRAVQSSVAPRPSVPPTTQAVPHQTVAPPSAVPVRPAPPIAKPVAPVASSATVAPEAPRPAPRFIKPQATVRQPSAVISPPKPPAVKPVQTAAAVEVAKPSEPTIEDQVAVLDDIEAAVPESQAPQVEVRVELENEVAAKAESPVATPPRPAAPVRPGQLGAGAPPPRRLIVPQTGPRPVYLAPPGAVRPAAKSVPRVGMPERGKPIFQRPRPGVAPPGATRPPVRPGERRGPHPTRSGAPGTRPGFGPGAGVAPPPPTGQRPAGRPARPGQRYVPRGVKEGPMKGFVPPPRLSLSSEPLPITRNITIPEGISVKDLAEKLEIRAKDLIAR